MEEEKKLYPFRFCTLEDTYSWGTEEFKLADLGYRDSLVHDGWLAANTLGEVMDMYMDRVVGDNVFEYWGRQFPICVRTLNVKGRMPLRVSPDDEVASERYDFLGKEKLWYVLKAGKDAKIMAGFRKDTDATEVYTKCLDNSIEDILNVIAPHAGQFIHIAPGTPHAACGDMTILEVSESSPLDFCLCGWGENVSPDEFDESLNVVDALDFINYKKYVADDKKDFPQFNVAKMDLKDPLHVYSENFDTFVIYWCLEGGASVDVKVLEQTASFAFGKGELILVPAECNDFNLSATAPGTSIFEIAVPFRKDSDAYINPEAEPALPEDQQ